MEELKEKIESLKEEALKALENDDLELAKEKREEIKKLEEELKKLEEENKEDEDNQEVDVKVTENRSLRNDGFEVSKPEVTSAEVRAFEKYLQGEKRDINGGSLKTDSGFVVIPEEIVTDILKIKEAEFNLDQFVTVKKVSNGTG